MSWMEIFCMVYELLLATDLLAFNHSFLCYFAVGRYCLTQHLVMRSIVLAFTIHAVHVATHHIAFTLPSSSHSVFRFTHPLDIHLPQY